MKEIRRAVETAVIIVGAYLAISALKSVFDDAPVKLPDGWPIFLLAVVIGAGARAFVDWKRSAALR